ncbi:hypothetical protein Ancab_011484 [Ancistrocladus abbreviatus]
MQELGIVLCRRLVSNKKVFGGNILQGGGELSGTFVYERTEHLMGQRSIHDNEVLSGAKSKSVNDTFSHKSGTDPNSSSKVMGRDCELGMNNPGSKEASIDVIHIRDMGKRIGVVFDNEQMEVEVVNRLHEMEVRDRTIWEMMVFGDSNQGKDEGNAIAK